MDLLRKIFTGFVLTVVLCACNGDVFTKESEYNNNVLEIYPYEITLSNYVGAEEIVMFNRGDWFVDGLFDLNENSLGIWTDMNGKEIAPVAVRDQPFTCVYRASSGLTFTINRVNPDDIRIQVTNVPAGKYAHTFRFRVFVNDVYDVLYIHFNSASQQN